MPELTDEQKQAELEDRVKRFNAKFMPEKDGCWIWTASARGSGYGQFYLKKYKRQIEAHRASWLLHVGDIPDGLQVLHRCDVRLCVNPEHLFLGTAKDNTQDMIAKNRQKMGSKSKTGIRGVHWNERWQRWQTNTDLANGKKQLYWGSDFVEACCARKSWEAKACL